MNRLRVKAGNQRSCGPAVLLSLLVVLAAPSLAAAQTASTDYWFAGTRLVLERPQVNGATVMVPSDDRGLARFLVATGATLAYQPGQKYLIVTAADRRTIAFTLGSTSFTSGGIAQTAPVAPYASGRVAYVPFEALAKALYVDPVPDAATTVLQPQLASLDVRVVNRATVVTVRGGTPLHYRRLTAPNDTHVALAFTGVGSTLERERQFVGPGITGVVVASAGSPRNPTTVVDYNALPGSAHALVASASRNSVAVAFAPPGVALGGSALPAAGEATVGVGAAESAPGAAGGGSPAVPAPPAPPSPVAVSNGAIPAASVNPGAPAGVGGQPAHVTSLDVDPGENGLTARVALTGGVRYEWHVLPDNRWFVDLKPAVLAMAPRETVLGNDTVQSLRIKGFVGPTDRLPTVRVAFTLTAPHAVALVGTPAGLALTVDGASEPGGDRVGVGAVANGAVVASAAAPQAGSPAVAPPGPDAGSVAPPEPAPTGTWKFAPAASYNSRLIVIDPGHGGSDSGAMHNGLTEKDLTLDISRRLRDLLVSRGWVVKLTRTSDVDVFAPNDSARDELQARCDVANAAGARLFISVHINSFTSGGQNGTTTYYFRPESYAFAQAVHDRLAATLPTADDGIKRENFYVVHHTTMPSILVETAFLSNLGDAALLRQPTFLQKVALGIADGVGTYASGSRPVSQLDPGGN